MTDKSEDAWSREVTNSKIARTMVMGGLVMSFTVICIGSTILKIKNIATKPFNNRKTKNGKQRSRTFRSSSDLC